MSSQQMTTGPAPMKGIERMNVVIVKGSGQGMGALRRNPYMIEVDRGRNCYAYRGFRHIACHCRNQRRGRVIEERRIWREKI